MYKHLALTRIGVNEQQDIDLELLYEAQQGNMTIRLVRGESEALNEDARKEYRRYYVEWFINGLRLRRAIFGYMDTTIHGHILRDLALKHQDTLEVWFKVAASQCFAGNDIMFDIATMVGSYMSIKPVEMAAAMYEEQQQIRISNSYPDIEVHNFMPDVTEGRPDNLDEIHLSDFWADSINDAFNPHDDDDDDDEDDFDIVE